MFLVGIPGWYAHHVLSVAERTQSATAVEALLAVALDQFVADSVGLDSAQRAKLRDVTAEAERIRWAGIVDADGGVTEFRRRTSLPIEQIVAQVDLAAARPVATVLRVDGHDAPQYRLVTLPRDDGRVLAAIVDYEGRSAQGAYVTAVIALAFAAVALVLVGALFQQWIVRPAISVAKRASAVQQELALTELDADTPIELAGLVKSVESTVRELKQWRTQATYLQNAFDSEVIEKTKTVRRALEQAEQHAETDTLTKLRNRRTLERVLPDMVDEHLASARELTAVLVDVNNFKVLNDSRGHQVGDALLTFVGELLRSTTRRGADLAIRYGGDEFVLILPDTDGDEAVQLSQRLAAMFGQRARTLPTCDPPTGLSFGVASLMADEAGDAASLLKLADVAMYFAKRHGLSAATVAEARRAQRPKQA